MAIVPTPLMPGAGIKEAPYRGPAMAQLRILKQQMQTVGLKVGSRLTDLGNGVTCSCRICFNLEEVFILGVEKKSGDFVAVSGGVILHPRSGAIQNLEYTEYTYNSETGITTTVYSSAGVIGGWKNGTEVLNTSFIYPLVDADDASFLVFSSANQSFRGKFLNAVGNYGNLYWCNDKQDPDYETLSWRGTPTRHFRLPSGMELPGLSILETNVTMGLVDLPQYTTFGTKLYKSGSVLAQSPLWSWPQNQGGTEGRCLILGAARNKVDGKVYIVAQSDHYSAPATALLGTETHTLVSPGIWLTLWKTGTQLGGWDLVSETLYERNGLPWFANYSGSEFICSNGDRLTSGGVLTQAVGTTGTYQETATTRSPPSEGKFYYDLAQMSFSATFVGSDYSEHKGSVAVSSPINLAFSVASVVAATADVSHTYEGTFPYFIPDPGVLTVSGSDYYPGGTYTASGGQPGYTWEYPAEGSCGTQTITVTDACGATASMSVRMPLGVWVFVSQQEAPRYGGEDGLKCPCSYGVVSGWNPNDCTGNTRTMEYISQAVKELAIGDCGLEGNPGTCLAWSGPTPCGTAPFLVNAIARYEWRCP
jgi:hypothetical protein